MRRILYVSDAQSVHTRRWAEHYRDEGGEIHVASFRPADLPGVTVHVLPTGGFGRAGYFLAVPMLRRLAKRLRPDVVHAQYVTSYGFLAALAGLHPLVLTAWGTDVLISPRESRLLRAFARFAVARADAVTTVAAHMNPSVEALGPSGLVVTAIPFGVDVERFRPPQPPRRAGASVRVICTRNFGPVYAVDTLVSAVAAATVEGVALDLDLVGQGPLRADLEAQVASSGLGPRTTFHGHVTHDRLVGLLGAADVFVSPALSDGNNVSLNEAMACGCFPVATDIPANAQWIRHGENGLLYPPGDAAALAACLIRAASDRPLREAAAVENRRIVETRADWRVCVRRMDEVYARAARGCGAMLEAS
jgi:glycosyltransferase involved in cell wall biosynthesis